MSETRQVKVSPEEEEEEAEIRTSLAPLHTGIMQAVAHNTIDTGFRKLMEARKDDTQLAAQIDASTDEFCRLYGVNKEDIAHLL